VLWAGSPERFKDAIEGLERLKPGFCARYDTYHYEDLPFLPEAPLKLFNQVMANIGQCARLLDGARVPLRDAQGRRLSFWERLIL